MNYLWIHVKLKAHDTATNSCYSYRGEFNSREWKETDTQKSHFIFAANCVELSWNFPIQPKKAREQSSCLSWPSPTLPYYCKQRRANEFGYSLFCFQTLPPLNKIRAGPKVIKVFMRHALYDDEGSIQPKLR